MYNNSFRKGRGMGMKRVLMILTLLVLCGWVSSAQVLVKQVKGLAEVRRGVAEEWTTVKPGDSLTADNTLKVRKGSSVAILTRDAQRIVVPELTVLDIGDLRTVTQQDLLLKLAMADVRAAPAQERPAELTIPRTTIVHGKEYPVRVIAGETPRDYREMEVRGTKVLYDHGYYPTCILRAKELLQVYPDLKDRFEFRMMIAEALERTKLRGPALNEYLALAMENLPPKQKAKVNESIHRLKGE